MQAADSEIMTSVVREKAGCLDGSGNVPSVVTIMVNWNGCSDTIECLESLFGSDYPNQHVIVIDNGSRDGSLQQIAVWASGAAAKSQKTEGDTFTLGQPCDKALSVVTFGLEDLGDDPRQDFEADLVLIDAKKNRGFAAGVNLGLRFALAHRAVRYVWVLNNDTVVASDCLTKMVRRISGHTDAGMCGCRILFYHHPDCVQTLGGARFRSWLGASYLLGANQPASRMVNPEQIERSMHHLSGVSMLVSTAFLREVGLMDESYFLYYEEVDWATRGEGRYRLVYADDALVYHKEGASIGSSHQHEKRSALSAYFLIRSRLRFTRKFYPWALPTVLLYSAVQTLRTFFQGHGDLARAMLSALRGVSAKNAIGWNPDA